jgi:hypothetical protein
LSAVGEQRGQSLAEFALITPVVVLLLLVMLEFGLAFSDRLTIGNATRQGARVGSALVTGSSTACTGDPSGVDITIVASVQNILKSGGSDVDLSQVSEIRIFKANAAGDQIGSSANTWRYNPGGGPDADSGPGTEILDFSPVTVAWPACTRHNGSGSPDSLAVRITYDYRLRTPLAAVLLMFGGEHEGVVAMVDKTVMALNPTD